MKKFLPIFFLVGILLIVLGGLILNGKFTFLFSSDNNSAVTVRLGLSWIHEAQFAGEYYADQHSLYKDRQLEVSLVPYDSENNPDLVEQLLSKKLDFAILQADTLLKARSEGKPIVGIFVTYRKSPTVFISKRESNITTPKDFKNKKVAVAYSEKIPLITIAKLNTLPLDSFTIIDREFSYEPLLNNTYDVEAGWVTDLDTVEKLGMRNPSVIYAADYGANLFGDIIATTEETINTRPKIVHSLVQATQLGWIKALEDTDASSKLTMKYQQNLDPVHLKYVLNVSLPLIQTTPGSKIGDSTYIEWRKIYEILKDQNLIQKEFDVNKAFTRQFIN